MATVVVAVVVEDWVVAAECGWPALVVSVRCKEEDELDDADGVWS